MHHGAINMDSRRLAQLCRTLAENKKAEDVVVLDLRTISSFTEYFVIASGTSCRHQIKHLTSAAPRHMAQALAEALAPAPADVWDV